MKAPAIPIITAWMNLFFGIWLILKTITPAIKAERDLWSLITGTESITELIRGTKNGAIRLADITAIMLGSRTTPLILYPTDDAETNAKSKLILIDKTDQGKVMPN